MHNNFIQFFEEKEEEVKKQAFFHLYKHLIFGFFFGQRRSYYYCYHHMDGCNDNNKIVKLNVIVANNFLPKNEFIHSKGVANNFLEIEKKVCKVTSDDGNTYQLSSQEMIYIFFLINPNISLWKKTDLDQKNNLFCLNWKKEARFHIISTWWSDFGDQNTERKKNDEWMNFVDYDHHQYDDDDDDGLVVNEKQQH